MGHPFHTRHIVVGSRKPEAGGFTLIEMIVVLTIIIIVSAIAIGGQQNFDRTLALNNVAYGIALGLREAQTYGLTSLLQQSNPVKSTYGINFNRSTGTKFILFSDVCPVAPASAKPDDSVSGRGHYDAGGCTGVSTEKVTDFNLNNGFSIQKFCAISSAGSPLCTTGSLSTLDVTFTRPEAEAVVCPNQVNCASSNYTSACIVVGRTGSGETRTVIVSSSGQIAVTSDACG